ncbi:NAD(P)H dehydrogenase [Rhizobium sp. Root274]|uniref:NAD(P)H-dependent oxidoreductase n=1 Tax=unclassified Rhizobium TaxID=2613769 RepID=UPI000712FABD|nr:MULTISPECIES: NAD(P)H-dependent oxidoreductase [unclassified Rhizobium]KQW25463.1 NAD(P)H dehydrogenase [Rhizobium sp. Root1240]KRD26083.1 NAD(P)H dehydrogenase [Rhizobium sp. Root274]
MSKTIILLFHPDLSRSRANTALARAAAKLPDVEVVDMQSVYPNGIDLHRDGEGEAARLLAADRMVFQFPLQWYSTPPLLKAWQDAVLTRMFYMHYEAEGRVFEGTELLLAVTLGNSADAYRSGGSNIFELEALLAPLRATANRCGLAWSSPFVLYEAHKLSPEALEAAAAEYVDRLAEWIASTPSRNEEVA